MRLLHARSLEIREFFDANIPRYAILSHTWESDEPTFQAFQMGLAKETHGYKKIEYAALQALEDGYNWVWIDTICIDKTNSTELFEAINSMFRWYAESQVCYAYLSDVNTPPDIPGSRWFTRGWTLQELLAPSQVIFYNKTWQKLGAKSDKAIRPDSIMRFNMGYNMRFNMRTLLLSGTGISPSHDRVFEYFQPDKWTIAERMSWASKRVTSRREDIAYSLLGIFGVHMPLLYGEGDHAFIRLQEEIMRISDDQSLFAWADNEVIPESHCGLLARSPRQFRDSSNLGNVHWRLKDTIDIKKPHDPHGLTNQGIQIKLTLIPENKNEKTYYALLGYGTNTDRPAIVVQHLVGNEYTRIRANTILTSEQMAARMTFVRALYRSSRTLTIRQQLPDLQPREERPHFVVSIDFGMMDTSVAYCNFTLGSDNIRHISQWPGSRHERADRVPTLLSYPKGNSTPLSWGFLAGSQKYDPAYEIRKRFKDLLDERVLEAARQNAADPYTVPLMYEVEKWCTDYFQFLYREIECVLKRKTSRWEDARVEYIFSVPTVWVSNQTVERFRKIISLAGFGNRPAHSAIIGLTEAEAVAVYAAHDKTLHVCTNGVLLVCDAREPIMNLSVFRIKDNMAWVEFLLEPTEITPDLQAATIGSRQFDDLFENLVLERLEAADKIRPLGLGDLHLTTARKMTKCKEYQQLKASNDFGLYSDCESFPIRVPRLPRTLTCYSNHITLHGGEMIFTKGDFQKLFDVQIGKLFKMIDESIIRLQDTLPDVQVENIVLSGWVETAYIANRLYSRYARGNAPHPNARRVDVIRAGCPELAVCKGNVADRLAKLERESRFAGDVKPCWTARR